MYIPLIMKVLRQNGDENFSEYSQLIEPDSIRVEYYGPPPASTLEIDIQSGVDLILKPGHIAGLPRATNV